MSINLDPVTPDFRINNVPMPLPSTIQWEFPKAWEIDGGGFERLEPFGTVTLTWSFMNFDDFTTLLDAWEAITGTASIKLPAIYGELNSPWVTYTQAILDMPRPQKGYFENYHADVKMTVRRVNPGRSTVL